MPEPPAGEDGREVRFQAASADGSKVFFTDTARLTEDSTQEPIGEESPTDLYEFELTSVEPLRGRLVDLSSGAAAASGDVLNLIPGSSTDGVDRVLRRERRRSRPGATTGPLLAQPRRQRSAHPRARPATSTPPKPTRLTRASARRGSSRRLSGDDAADWGAGASSHLAPSQLNVGRASPRASRPTDATWRSCPTGS